MTPVSLYRLHTARIHFAGLIYGYIWGRSSPYMFWLGQLGDMLVPFLDIFMSIGQHQPPNDAHISLQTPYCMHPFCETYLWVYVMTFIILFWLIGSIGGHAWTIFGIFDEHWTALASQWRPYLFTHNLLHASILWGLSMGICDDGHHIVLVDRVNRGSCWDIFSNFWWALDHISLTPTPVPLYRRHTACIHLVRHIYGHMWWRSSYYSGWLGQ